MGSKHTEDATVSPKQRADHSVEGSGELGTPEMHVFTELQQETDEVGINGILKDPEYLDFLESFGELAMPDDDEMNLTELVELETDDSTLAGASSEVSLDQHQRTDDNRSEVIDDLIHALENDAVSEAQRTELREALGLQNRKSMEVQFNHLKSRFLDLEAYIQAMEEFFEQDTNPLDETEALWEELSMLQAEIGPLSNRLNTTEQEITTVSSNHTEQTEELASLEQLITQTRGALRQNLAEIETELKRNDRWHKRVSEAFRRVDSEPEASDPDDLRSNKD